MASGPIPFLTGPVRSLRREMAPPPPAWSAGFDKRACDKRPRQLMLRSPALFPGWAP